MKSIIKFGTAFGSSLNIHASWLLFMPLSVFTLVWLEIEPLLEAIVTTLLLFSSVMLTVLAQTWAARRSGLSWQAVTIFMIGGIVQRDSRSTPWQAFKVASAGLVVNITLALVFGALWFALPVGALGIEMEIVSLFNVALLLFSLLVRLTPSNDSLLHSAFASLFSREWTGYLMTFINSAALSIFCVVGILFLSFNWIGFAWWFAIALMLSQMTTIADYYGEYDMEKPIAQTEPLIDLGNLPSRDAGQTVQ